MVSFCALVSLWFGHKSRRASLLARGGRRLEIRRPVRDIVANRRRRVTITRRRRGGRRRWRERCASSSLKAHHRHHSLHRDTCRASRRHGFSFKCVVSVFYRTFEEWGGFRFKTRVRVKIRSEFQRTKNKKYLHRVAQSKWHAAARKDYFTRAKTEERKILLTSYRRRLRSPG